MAEEVKTLVPDRRHFYVTAENWPEMRPTLRRYRIGLAPVMLTAGSNALRRAAYRLAPRKILAYNSRLERHHLKPGLASFLFWRGVPLDRIYLRPWSWPKREQSVVPLGHRRLEGRQRSREAAASRSSLPTFPIRSRMAAPSASSTCCGNWRASSMSSCSLSPMATSKPVRCGVLHPRGAGAKALVSGAALVHAAPARSARIPVSAMRPRLPTSASLSATSGCKWSTRSLPSMAATCGGARRHVRSIRPDPPPRPLARRVVGPVPAGAALNAARWRVTGMWSSCRKRTRTSSEPPSTPQSLRTESILPAFSRTAIAWRTPALHRSFRHFPNIEGTVFSRRRFGPCYATSSRI